MRKRSITMKALEFISDIKHNQILIPEEIQNKLPDVKHKKVRVIVLIDEPDTDGGILFKQVGQQQFLNGYVDGDSIYDNY